MTTAPLTIGLLVPFTAMYEGMPESYRAEKEAFAAQVAAVLAPCGTVVSPGTVASAEEAAAAGERFRAAGVDVVVVAPSMAVVAEVSWACLRQVDAPVLVWNAQVAEALPADYNAAQLVRHSANVGTFALTNTLLRAGRRFDAVVGPLHDHATQERVRHKLRAHAAAAALRRTRLGLIGGAFQGMLDIYADPAALRLGLGPTVVQIEGEELADAVRSVPAGEVNALLTDASERYTMAWVHPVALERSARLARAFELLTERHRLDGGAVNCHTSAVLHHRDVGVCACWAVSLQTTAGRPWSCTGDLPTAIALGLAKRLAGSALYVELDFNDYAADFVVLSNGGEADLTLAAERPLLRPNVFYTGQSGRGASFVFGLSPGPATLLGFTPCPGAPGGWRLVAAAGELLGSRVATLDLVSARFRFHAGPTAAAVERWCLAGANHHAALAPGDLLTELREVAWALGIDCAVIGANRRQRKRDEASPFHS